MNKKEFMQYIGQLQNVYDKELSETELDIWYKNLSYMSIERFNYIIAEVYKINKFMPKLSEILEINSKIPYVSPKKVSGKCEKCNNVGYVLYFKEIEGRKYTYAAVCDCGRQVRYDGTKCKDVKNQSKFYIPTMNEIGLTIKTSKPTKEQILSSMIKLKNSPIISENIREIIRKEYAKLR